MVVAMLLLLLFLIVSAKHDRNSGICFNNLIHSLQILHMQFSSKHNTSTPTEVEVVAEDKDKDEEAT